MNLFSGSADLKPGACHAAKGREELSLCLANRSAALFHLCLYQECLQDISWALDQGYPIHLQQKLLNRRAQCLNRLGQKKQGKEDGIHSTIKTINAEHQQQLPQRYGSIPSASPAVTLQFSPSKGRHLLAAEDIAAGEVVLEEKAFSFVLIPGGAPVARPENDNSKMLGMGAFNTEEQLCHSCLQQTFNPLPCQGCSYARYCSEQCRKEAWAGYHCSECPVGGELRAAGVLAHLALRVALKAGLDEIKNVRRDRVRQTNRVLYTTKGNWKSIKSEGNDDEGNLSDELSVLDVSQQGKETGRDTESQNSTSIQGCDTSGCYLGDSYISVHHLLPHVSEHESGLRFLCMVTIATLCLRLQEMGPSPELWKGLNQMSDNNSGQSQAQEEDSRGWSPELTMLGTAALRHMLQLRCNAQAVTILKEKGLPDSTVQSIQEVRIATAIFPTLSLLNHSCSPNTSVTFQTDPASDQSEASLVPRSSTITSTAVTVTVRTTLAVKAGQELLHCYGPHCSRMPLKDRQRLLQDQYFFLCRCTACCLELESEGKAKSKTASPGFLCVQCGSTLQVTSEISCGDDGFLCSSTSCGFQLSKADLSRRLQDLQGHLDQAKWLLDRSRPAEALRRLQAATSQASQFLPETHPVRGELADTSARAYATMGETQATYVTVHLLSHGSWGQAAVQLRCSVAAVRAQYGEDSVELGHQLFKLAQLHFNGREPQLALEVIPKARHLLSLHCSSRCEELMELQAMEDCLWGLL
ncbi:hypothetical protein JZ751_022872 [Albula glossodonta]|uniref:Protein-lysine N-methyltransferase SMYD4 n=1 Tax=Albula glossodonta TaxID=121402 RepID=A0A8T2PK97_9TELE|nr:hypothetical protein JZ751_022872 [Albula glossodonta]